MALAQARIRLDISVTTIFGLSCFEAYQQVIMKTDDQVTPHDILLSLIKSIPQGLPLKEEYLKTTEILSQYIQEDMDRGVSPDLLARRILQINDYQKEIEKLKTLAKEQGIKLRNESDDFRYSEQTDRLECTFRLLKNSQKYLLENLVESDTFKHYKLALSLNDSDDYRTIKDLLKDLRVVPRGLRFLIAAGFLSQFIQTDEEKMVFPDLMALRLANMTYFEELREQKFGGVQKNSSKQGLKEENTKYDDKRQEEKRDQDITKFTNVDQTKIYERRSSEKPNLFAKIFRFWSSKYEDQELLRSIKIRLCLFKFIDADAQKKQKIKLE